jgi:hypothetical protein
MNANEPIERVFQKMIFIFSVITSISLVAYGVASLMNMQAVNPEGFIPSALPSRSGSGFNIGILSALCVLAYAFSFLPVIAFFTVKKYQISPAALILAACLLLISFVLEIVNSLPLLSLGILGGKVGGVSPDVQLYVHQMDAVKFMAFDVAGFTLAYIAFGIYALVFFRTKKILSFTMIGSIITFIANVPFLWIAPPVAVILMVISIFAFAVVPPVLAKMALNK